MQVFREVNQLNMLNLLTLKRVIETLEVGNTPHDKKRWELLAILQNELNNQEAEMKEDEAAAAEEDIHDDSSAADKEPEGDDERIEPELTRIERLKRLYRNQVIDYEEENGEDARGCLHFPQDSIGAVILKNLGERTGEEWSMDRLFEHLSNAQFGDRNQKGFFFPIFLFIFHPFSRVLFLYVPRFLPFSIP